jgi:hypothetical protein
VASGSWPCRPWTTEERACAWRPWRIFWLWVALAGIFLIAPLARAASEAPTSLDAYWNLVETTYTRLTELASVSPETARPALEELAVQWDAVIAVELPDGTILPVDTRYFAVLLAVVLAARETWTQGDFVAADLIPLTGILRQPEFQWQAAPLNPIQQFIQEVLRRINNALVNFLDWLFPASEGAIVLPLEQLFTFIAALLLIAIFLYILYGTWGSLIAEAENAANGEGETTPLTAAAARQRARQLAQAGDHRTAIRYLYLASLLLLEERGLLRYDRTLTNRETLQSVANRPDLAAPLREVVETFDRVWYGYQEVDEPTFEHYAERVEDLRQQKKGN